MKNGVIYILEKYLGFVLCFMLDMWRNVLLRFLRSKNGVPAQKVMFVKFIEQGALVLHRPAFEKAVKIYGIEHVYLCTFSSNKELASALGVFDPENILEISEKSILSFAASYFKSLLIVRRLKIDSIIDLEFFSRATAIFCYLSGCNNRVGYHRFGGSETYRGDLFTHKLNYSPYEHVGETGVMLLNALGYDPQILPSITYRRVHADSHFVYTAKPDRLTHWKNYLSQTGISGPWIILNPNFNDPLPLRQWSPDNYLDVVKGIRRHYPNAGFIFTGRADELYKTQSFIELNNIGNAINLCGKTTIHDLLSLYFIVHLMVTSDSGPGHFASLTPLHSIVLFGPETPQLYGPKGENTHIVYKGISCSPCFNVFNNRTSDCKNNLCLRGIQSSEIVELSRQVLTKHHLNFHGSFLL